MAAVLTLMTAPTLTAEAFQSRCVMCLLSRAPRVQLFSLYVLRRGASLEQEHAISIPRATLERIILQKLGSR